MIKRIVLTALMVGAAAMAQTAPPTGQFIWMFKPVRAGFGFGNITPEEQAALDEHGKSMVALKAQGRLVTAVQVFEPNGVWGMIVITASSLEEAKAMARNDPFVKAGFAKGDVFPARVPIDRCTELAQPAK